MKTARRRDCGVCEGTGRQPDTKGQKTCPYCAGSGKQSAGSVLQRKQWNPPEVSSVRGAPMGRARTGDPKKIPFKVRKVKWGDPNDAYDAGGAYWGMGANLYVLLDSAEDPIQFVRATSLKDALSKLLYSKETK